MELKAIRPIEIFGKIELPQDLRLQLNWKIDDVIEFYTENGTIIMQPSKEHKQLRLDKCHKFKYRSAANGCNFCGKCGSRWPLGSFSSLSGIPIP